jgi:GT2 family glycosyltransferase
MKIAVIIASTGRPVEAARWVEHCAAQTLPPVELIYSLARPMDLPADFTSPHAQVIIGRGGLTTQRNTGMAALSSDPDIIVFFDDDYVPSRYCFEGIAKSFSDNRELVATSGVLLSDGINSAGVPYEDARRMIGDFDRDHYWPIPAYRPLDGAYGCNMAFRATAIAGERFDERLPLYGWQEDVDFSRRVARRGQMATSNLFTGVHQGTKGGRTSGRKLGYSQVANIVYLMRKGTMPAGKGLRLVMGNMLANHGKVLRPEPWIDRKGRSLGNWQALRDCLIGKVSPERILEM